MANPAWRIARALCRKARSLGQEVAVGDDLAALAVAVTAVPGVTRLLQHPRVALAPKVELLAGVVRTGLVREIIAPLVAGDAAGLLPEVATAFRLLARRAGGEVDVDITSALPLSEEEERRITESVARAWGRSARVRRRVDPSLIAGVRVRVDGRRFESSLASRLAALNERLQAP